MMHRLFPLAAVLALTAAPPALRADAFDNYTNPVLAKVPDAAGVKELKQLTGADMAEHARALPGSNAAFVVVKTNEDRYSKLLVQPARQKVAGKPAVPILLIERFVTYKEGQEQAVLVEGKNVRLFHGFQFNLDQGQVVPAAVGGDLRVVADQGKMSVEPVGKAKLYLVTKLLPGAAVKKPDKLVVGAVFEPRYFNGTYKLYDDGRRSGTLRLTVGPDGEVTGSYVSGKDGQKYEVAGKIGMPPHTIQFTITFPATKQTFQGWLFTGDGKALTGFSRLQERETGFYAVREEE
jgi:hypothetical protein